MRPTPDHSDQEVLADRLPHGQLQAQRLNDHGQQHDIPAPREYVRECGLETCVQAIDLTAAEFEGIPQRTYCFAVAFGQVSLTPEIVVEEHDRYPVVQRARPRLDARAVNHHRRRPPTGRPGRRVGSMSSHALAVS